MDTKRIEATALDTENEDESLPVYSHEGDSRLPPSDSNLEVTEKQGLGLNEDPLAFEAIPSVEACLTHLKLLRAFEGLKQKVGYTDGLWDIWDSRAQGKLDILVKLREKRWALYVARAVNRYEVWWQSFVPRMLLEKDMIKQPGGTESSTYEGFVSQSEHIRWTTDILPPPDVLLVWHTHMLNPRIYLEDCIRIGFGALWSAGMPWLQIEQCINSNFEFAYTQNCRLSWSERTQLEWINEEDISEKDIKCPMCSESKLVQWSTCGQPENSQGKPGLVGEGYGDGAFTTTCKSCGTTIDEELLRAAKFRDDLKNLVTKDWPMPGTILSVTDGLLRPQDPSSDQLFPNRLVRQGLLVEVTQAFENRGTNKPNVMFITDQIKKITGQTKYRHSSDQLKKIDKGISGVGTAAHHVLSMPARRQTRCMMSRYWTNSSIFGLDLRSAVMRQGVFCEKMFKINWLQSPTSRFTMQKLLKKYERFFEIAAANPGEVVTPTLDVDLAWHTHQLSPKQYFRYAVQKTGVFMDHDDKVDEDKLGISFEWMTKVYQKKYGEAYSECTCWFCESLRFKHASSLLQRFASKKESYTSEPWRTANRPATALPHISSHPSVHPLSERNSARRTERYLFHNDLDAAYAKFTEQSIQSKSAKGLKNTFSSVFKSSSEKAANKSASSDPATGFSVSRGEDKAAHWGKSIALRGPWASITHATLTEQMYAASPAAIHENPGMPGVCAGGTCGGMTGCGNRAVAMCGSGCTGMGKSLVGPGCAGGA